MSAGRDIPCPMCSAPATDVRAGCTGCPLSRGCTMSCCPRCGYRFLEESAALGALRSLFGRLRALTGSLEQPS